MFRLRERWRDAALLLLLFAQLISGSLPVLFALFFASVSFRP
jgi:hypothetical protein